ncbi:sulfotransferase family protein [Ideonella livida]|uniref:Sulfotransferase n=1 Tax=Ideonella livida TaxID=2707176 RepID=A0A7C9TLE2_9BURK|nr:sulfotransferase [Ideonella livida]NDY90906.1 sulfotransferase [Ideonella livida]
MTRWNAPAVYNLVGARPVEELGWAASVEASLQGDRLQVSGWALSSQGEVPGLWLCLGEERMAVALEHPSPDVAQVYPAQPWAARCRFSVALPLPQGEDCQDPLTVMVHGQPLAGAPGMHLATLICSVAANAGRKVFVVGSPRSGTTAVGNAIRGALGLPNYGEAHLLPVLHGLIEALDRLWETPSVREAGANVSNLVAHVPPEEIRSRLGTLFRQMYRHLHAGQSFCDKTPGVPMLRALPLAQVVWPDARFIFCHRRGVENVASRLRKFGAEGDFQGHCQDWSMAMRVWLESSALLSPGSWLQVEQRELALAPDTVAQRLAQHLQLEPDQHQRLAEYLRHQRPEQTALQAEQHPVGLQDLGWPPEQVDTFRSLCGEMMQRYGYLEDARYSL